MIRRLWSRLRYGPPCDVEPPWKLPDAGPCILGVRVAHEWHGDGEGYQWTDAPPHGTGRWFYIGATVSVQDVYDADPPEPGRYDALFTEHPAPPRQPQPPLAG